MAIKEQVVLTANGMAKDSAIPPVTIKIPIPKSTQPPAQPSSRRAAQ